MLTDLRVQGGAVGVGDVREVRDHGVEGTCCTGEEVRLFDVNAVGDMVSAGIFAGDFEGG